MKKVVFSLSLLLIGTFVFLGVSGILSASASNVKIQSDLTASATTETDPVDDTTTDTTNDTTTDDTSDDTAIDDTSIDDTVDTVEVVDDETIAGVWTVIEKFYASDILVISNPVSDDEAYANEVVVNLPNSAGEIVTYTVYYDLVEGTEVTADDSTVTTDVIAIVIVDGVTYDATGTYEVLDDENELNLVVIVDDITYWAIEIDQESDELEFDLDVFVSDVAAGGIKAEIKVRDLETSYYLHFETTTTDARYKYEVDTDDTYVYSLDYSEVVDGVVVASADVKWNEIIDETTGEVSYDFVIDTHLRDHYDHSVDGDRPERDRPEGSRPHGGRGGHGHRH